MFRLRCYSESNLDDYGWNSVSSGLSQTRIMEEDEEEEEDGGHREVHQKLSYSGIRECAVEYRY